MGDAAAMDAYVRAVIREELRDEIRPLRALVEALVAREPDEWLSVEEAARVLNVEVVTARRMAARGDLAAKKCGKSWRIARSSLRAKTDAEVSVLAAEARR